MTKVYLYSGCDSCRKATAWMRANGFEFEGVSIRETPPTERELGQAFEMHGGQLRKLFNVSGQDYREEGMKDKLETMSLSAAVAALRANGNLVKRPFLATERGCVAGFSEELWSLLLN